jgi:hypothetical protein
MSQVNCMTYGHGQLVLYLDINRLLIRRVHYSMNVGLCRSDIPRTPDANTFTSNVLVNLRFEIAFLLQVPKHWFVP